MKTLTKQEVKERFTEIYEIGSGSFGRVVKAYDKETKIVVALKVISNEGKESVNIFEKEIENMKNISGSNNCVKIYDHFNKSNESMNIVMEYCGMGNISQYKSSMNNNILSVIAREVAKALCSIHEHGYIHLDVKPQNILLTTSGDIKLCDFGIMRKVNDFENINNDVTKSIMKEGTELYMAPEMMKTPITKESITQSADIYSLGMSLFELVAGVPLGLTNHDAVDEWLDDNNYEFACSQVQNDKKISKKNAKLIMQMLSENPQKRPKAQDIVNAFSDLPPSWIALRGLTKKSQNEFWD